MGTTACGESGGKDQSGAADGEKLTIGIVQMADNGAFTDMREGFLNRLEELGYTEDKLEVNYKNAQGDATNLNSICQEMVDAIQKGLIEKTGKHIEVMIYGDGAFKDPVGKIWELADPVVSPAYTAGLEGTPNEVKLKYLADNDFADLSGDALKAAISDYIKEKDAKAENLTGNMVSQGTTPRRLTDLIGSLADLTSGSGDKGTPIILIQGYFDNYTK